MKNEGADSYVFSAAREWVRPLGQFTIAFAMLEDATYTCIEHFSADQIHDVVTSMPFEPRVLLAQAVLKGLVKRLPDAEPNATHAIELLDHAADMAKHRNVLLHNAVQVGVYRDVSNENKLSGRLEIRSRRNQKKPPYTLEDTEALAHETSVLATELWETVGLLLQFTERERWSFLYPTGTQDDAK